MTHIPSHNLNKLVPVVFLDRHSPCCLASFHALIPACEIRDAMSKPDDVNPDCLCSFCGHSFKLADALSGAKFDALISSLHEADDSDISNMIESDFPVDPQTYVNYAHDDEAEPFDYFGEYIND